MEITSKAQKEEYMNNVVRALGSLDSGMSDYKKLDYDEVIVLAATMNTPLSARISRKDTAKDVIHNWLDQSLRSGAMNAQSETTDPSEAAAQKPTRYQNVLQIMSAKVAVTNTMRRIARAGGLHGGTKDELGRQVELQMKGLLRDQEHALMAGVLSATDPRQMAGLISWIPSATTLDLAAAQVTSSNVEGFLNSLIQKVVTAAGGAIPNALYVPAGLLTPLHTAGSAKIQIVVNLSDLAGGRAPKYVAGAAIGYFLSDFGMMEVVFTPELVAATTSGAAATSNALALFEDGLSIVDLEGAGMEVEDRAKSAPADTKVISQEITLEYRYQTAHAKLTNFYV